MVTTAQSITLSTGAIVPAQCDQHTPMDALPAYAQAYHDLTRGVVALATVQRVMDAMRDSGALVVLYTDGKCETAARVLWPNSVTVTKEKNLTARCYDTRTREWRTFRLDRFVSCHDLTTPEDAETEGTKPAQPDPVKMVTRLGTTLTTLAHTATLDAADTALLTDAIDDARRIYKTLATA